MRLQACLAAAVFLQGAVGSENDREAAREHFLYARELRLPPGAHGEACAVVDATLYAHADAPLNAMRLYAGTTETPFALTESGSLEQGTDPARVLNVGRQGEAIVFDLEMPARPYTEVNLNLDAHDFYATAEVSGTGGADGGAGKTTALGRFALFDLKASGLARSTTLPLQESTFRRLHVRLVMTPAPGGGAQKFGAAIVQGAEVPPNREAQTLYTDVAETSTITQDGHSSLAQITVPAHVPLERATFELRPGFTGNFMRDVTLATASAKLGDSSPERENLGQIERVILPAEGAREAIHAEQLSVPLQTAADLRGNATLAVRVENGNDVPLPIAAVKLQMRQRKICFLVQPGMQYSLLYGDSAEVKAPVYDYARMYSASGAAVPAVMQAETRNAGYVAREDERPYTERHPELLWIGLLAVVAGLGLTALQSVKRQGR